MRDNIFGENRDVMVINEIRILHFETWDGCKYATVTARSKRHADRLMRLLDWCSWSSGLAYCDVWYNEKRKRIELRMAYDV